MHIIQNKHSKGPFLKYNGKDKCKYVVNFHRTTVILRPILKFLNQSLAALAPCNFLHRAAYDFICGCHHSCDLWAWSIAVNTFPIPSSQYGTKA